MGRSVYQADLVNALRPENQNVPRVTRTRFVYTGDYRTDGENVDTEGEVPTLEITARVPVETTSLRAIGIRFYDEHEEEERETHTVRIFSESVPEAYVDVEVMDKVKLKTNKGERLTLTFSNPS